MDKLKSCGIPPECIRIPAGHRVLLWCEAARCRLFGKTDGVFVVSDHGVAQWQMTVLGHGLQSFGMSVNNMYRIRITGRYLLFPSYKQKLKFPSSGEASECLQAILSTASAPWEQAGRGWYRRTVRAVPS